MKKLLNMLAIVGVVTLLMGCTTMSGERRDLTPAIKVAAYVGTHYAIQEHPEWRAGFEVAALELGLLADAETIDFVQILAIIHRLPVKELKSPDAQLAITGATLLLTEYSGDVIPLDKLQQVRPLAAALRDGIVLALQ
jgi:hypothetical protein